MESDLQRLRWPLIALAFIGFLLIISGTLASNADTGPAAAFARLNQRSGNRLDVQWNTQSGVPDFVGGHEAADRIPYTPSAVEHGNPAAIARGFLDENRALFKLGSAADEFKTLRIEADAQRGWAHVRLAQSYKGIPVFGRQFVVHIDQQEQIVAVNGQYQPEIDLPTSAHITAADAERAALRDLMDTQLEPDEKATVQTAVQSDQTQLMVYVAENGKATLTWHIIIVTDNPLGEFNYFVNASRPAIVHRFDAVNTDKFRRTYSADNKTSIPGRLLAEEGERSDDPVAQAAHDGAGQVYDYYMATFKRDGIDGQGSPMISTVHYGSTSADSQNASWIGQRKQMVYGDGGQIFQPLAYGLDVVGHEFTHGVTDATAQLIYQGQSGALNESYSDVFGAMIDRGNWLIGETVIKSPPYPVPYLRNMEDPTAGGRYNSSQPLKTVGQPGHMRDYANLPLERKSDNGGVHVNSGIPNRAAYLIAQQIGREKTEQIYYRTLTQYLTPSSQFADAVQLTIRAAQDLYGATEAQAVRDGFAAVGLDANAPAATPTPSGTRRASTPTPAPTTPSQQPQGAAGCTNLVLNGGFEAQNQGWVEVSSQNAIIDTELPHSGARSAWLGGISEENLQYIYQDVRIPANASRVTLGYWRLVHNETEDANAAVASFWAIIADANGNALGTVEQIPSTDGDDTWRQGQFDITQFAGKPIRIAFISENAVGNLSSMFVDDVEMNSCSSGPVSQPTPTGNNVQIQGTIKNADTGRGIEGAKLFILKPGLSASDAAADDTITADEVLTFGVSDADGIYRTEAAIPRGQYSVIVIAGGFRPIVSDEGITIPSNAKGTYTVNATMRPSQ